MPDSALAIAEDILRTTLSLKLTGQPDRMEAEADAYADMIEKRQPLVDALAAFTAEGRDARTRKVVGEIVELDKQHQAKIRAFMTTAQSSMKELRTSQRINQGYGYALENESAGLLDAKQ